MTSPHCLIEQLTLGRIQLFQLVCKKNKRLKPNLFQNISDEKVVERCRQKYVEKSIVNTACEKRHSQKVRLKRQQLKLRILIGRQSSQKEPRFQ